MFDVSFWELFLVGIVALLVLGPEKLPRAARTAGLWIGKARRTLAEMQAEIERELDVEEIKRLNERTEPAPYPHLEKGIHPSNGPGGEEATPPSSESEYPDGPGERPPPREPDPNVPSATAKH